MSFSMRRVVIVTSRLQPPINNMQWRAVLGGSSKHTDPSGLGATEAEAVRDLYEEIAFREERAVNELNFPDPEDHAHHGEIEGK